MDRSHIELDIVYNIQHHMLLSRMHMLMHNRQMLVYIDLLSTDNKDIDMNIEV